MEDDINTIVIDNGTGMIKAGFSGEEAPRSIFPSVVARQRYNRPMIGASSKEPFVGDEEYEKASELLLKYPIEHGIIKNWDDIEAIWRYTFSEELRVDVSEHPVLMTHHPLNSKKNRDKMISLIFDTFNAKSYSVQARDVLTLYSCGRTTGLVLGAGDGITCSSSIYDGCSIYDSIYTYDIGGRDLIDFLLRMLNERGNFLDGYEGRENAKNIKERLCYVAYDYDKELTQASSSSEINQEYKLLDRNTITLGSELFRCPEMLFKPYLNGQFYDGIHKTIFDSIMKCEPDIRKELFANIILSGGTSMFHGFPERLDKEITALTPSTMKVRVFAPENRKYSVWIGGSILASLSTFPQMLVSKHEYQESGPGILSYKVSFPY